MLKKILLLAAVLPMAGCLGARVDTTAGYVAEVQAITDSNERTAELSKASISSLTTIRLAEIAARKEVQLKKIEVNAANKRPEESSAGIETVHCEQYRDEYPSQFGTCLDDEIRRSKVVAKTGASQPTITGDYNTVIIGSSGVDLKQGDGEDKESSITTALINGMNKNPFSPIPKPVAEQSIAVPLLNAGVSVAEKIVYGFLGYKAFDAIGDALSAGSSRDSVNINGDFQSNNPVTITKFAPPVAEP